MDWKPKIDIDYLQHWYFIGRNQRVLPAADNPCAFCKWNRR